MTEAKSFPILQMFNGLRLETKCGSFGCTMTKLFLRLILKTYRRLLNKRNNSINILSILTNDTSCYETTYIRILQVKSYYPVMRKGNYNA